MRLKVYYVHVLMGLCLVLSSVWGAVAQVPEISEENLNTVAAYIRDLDSTDPRTRSAAATQLKDYPYVEVKDALLRTLESEIQALSPNSYVLGGCLDALVDKMDRSDASRLGGLALSLAAIEEPWVGRIQAKLSVLIRESGEHATRNLPSLPELAVKTFFDWLGQPGQRGKLQETSTFKTLFDGSERPTLTDRVNELLQNPTNPSVVGRKDEVIKLLDVMVRLKGRVPVLVGEAGVGKTAVVQALAAYLKTRDIPAWEIYDAEFPAEKVYILQTSAARISRLALSNADSAQASALEKYFDAVRDVESSLDIKVIIFIDEIHTLSRAQINALKPYTEALGGIKLVGASTHGEFTMMTSNDNALNRRLSPITVEELSEALTFEVLKQGWISQIEARYHVDINDELLRRLIPIATDVSPDLARPDAQIKFIQDLAIHMSRTASATAENRVQITEEMARVYAGEQTGIPINPSRPQELVRYIEEGRRRIKERVIGQDHAVDVLVNTWQSILMSDAQKKTSKSVAILGTTGTGKSLSAEVLGEVYLQSREKVLVIDATAYQTGGLALNALIGAPPGVISSDETKGLLPEFLSGRGRSSGVIIINEFEKAHPDFAKRIMEMLDRGELTGGDGHKYRLRRHLIVLTSNRGANHVFNSNLSHLSSSEELANRARSVTSSQARGYFTQSDGYALMDENRLPPEVVNRIDQWVVAKPLTLEDVVKIATLKANELIRSNSERFTFKIELDAELIETIARINFTVADGARPVEQKIESLMSQVIASVWRKVENFDDTTITLSLVRDAQNRAGLQIFNTTARLPVETLDLDEQPRFMALHNPQFLETLRHLEVRMGSEIFGQDAAINTIASAVRARAMRPFDSSPLSVWLLGTTGVGKTELSRVLSGVLYGDKERARILSFGRVQHQYDLNDIFNPPRGVMGSESMSQFEQILQSFPEGTVIVFDEISNMGASVAASEKEALFKKFYEIFSEGRWINAHGKTYDLSNFIFILTGNDGERIFEDLPNEDLRTAAWENVRSREAITGILRHSHVPEAFINRIKALVMMNPLTDESRVHVVEKFTSRIASQMEEAHHVRIIFAEDFNTNVTRSFFPIGDGARGAERFVEQQLTAFIGDFLLKHLSEIRSAQQPPHIEVGLDLNYPERPWAIENSADRVEPTVTLRISGMFGEAGQEAVHTDSRQLEPTSAPRISSIEEARTTATHEAGHALVNAELGEPNGPLEQVTIRSAGRFGGYARYDVRRAKAYPDLESFIHQLAVLAAGAVSQEVAGMPRDAGMSNDLRKMREIATNVVLKLGLIEGLEFLPIDANGEVSLNQLDDQTRTRVNGEATKLINQAMKKAKDILQGDGMQAKVHRLVQLLIERGSINRTDFESILGKVACNRSHSS